MTSTIYFAAVLLVLPWLITIDPGPLTAAICLLTLHNAFWFGWQWQRKEHSR